MLVRKILIIMIIMIFAVVSAYSAGARESEEEEYPTRNITALIPYPAGGGSDTLTRHVEEHITDILGVGLDFVYREGAGGAVGVTELANMTPDGYTIGAANIPHIILQELTGTGQFTADDFDFIGQVAMTSLVLVTPADSPYTTVEEFIDAVRDNPGRYAVGLPGALGDSTIAAWMLQDEADIQFEMINYDGGAGLLSAILGGHIDAAFSAINMAIPEQDQMNLLATTLPSGQRNNDIPDIVTLSEYGYDVVVTTPRIYLAPAGLSDTAYTTLVNAFGEVTEKDEFSQAVENLGFTPQWIAGPDLRDLAMDLRDTIQRLLDQYHEN